MRGRVLPEYQKNCMCVTNLLLKKYMLTEMTLLYYKGGGNRD